MEITGTISSIDLITFAAQQAVIDSANQLAYFPCADRNQDTVLLKVNLATLEKVSTLTSGWLPLAADRVLHAGAIDTTNQFAYFAGDYSFTPTATSVTFNDTDTWNAPVGVTQVFVECWGAGGGGGFSVFGGSNDGGGAGGGAYSSANVTVIPGNDYDVTVGAGGTALNDNFTQDPTTAFIVTELDAANWNNISNILIDDSEFSNSDSIASNAISITDYIVATGFNFNVPSEYVITYVEVAITKDQSDENADIQDLVVTLVQDDGDVFIGDNMADIGSTWAPPGDPSQTFYSDGLTWGAELTPTIVNDPGFGVALQAFPNNDTPAEARVYYVNMYIEAAIPGAGEDSWFSTDLTVMAKGGSPGGIGSDGAGAGGVGGLASASIGTLKFNGGTGAIGGAGISNGGGGGSSAGSAANGTNGSGTTGGVAPTGGGNGGNQGLNGVQPGGGGGGAVSADPFNYGEGADGRIKLTWGGGGCTLFKIDLDTFTHDSNIMVTVDQVGMTGAVISDGKLYLSMQTVSGASSLRLYKIDLDSFAVEDLIEFGDVEQANFTSIPVINGTNLYMTSEDIGSVPGSYIFRIDLTDFSIGDTIFVNTNSPSFTGLFADPTRNYLYVGNSNLNLDPTAPKLHRYNLGTLELVDILETGLTLGSCYYISPGFVDGPNDFLYLQGCQGGEFADTLSMQQVNLETFVAGSSVVSEGPFGQGGASWTVADLDNGYAYMASNSIGEDADAGRGFIINRVALDSAPEPVVRVDCPPATFTFEVDFTKLNLVNSQAGVGYSTYLPDFVRANLRHTQGYRFTISGKKALYIRDNYTGRPDSVIRIVSEGC